jgi:integrase
MQDSDIAWALYVTLGDTGARIAEVAGLRVQDCDIEQGALQITVLKFSISL